MNIFVAKLSASTTSDDLKELFSEYGDVVSSKVIIDRETGNSKRFGFVEMADKAAGSAAIEALDGAEYDNAKIVVKEARPRDEQGGGNSRRPRSNNNNFRRPRRD